MNPSHTPEATVVVVTYNSADTIEQCLGSVPPSAELVVVDQMSSDDTLARVAVVAPRAKVIKAGGNRGFGAGCNLGAANAAGEVLIFLNPDGALRSGALEKLVSTSSQTGSLVGPALVDTNGSNITRIRRWSSLSSDLLDVFMPYALIPSPLRRDLPQEHRAYHDGSTVDYVMGSCLAIKASLFWSVAGFDERYFLYHEEEVLARDLKQRGIPTRVESGALVEHAGGHSTDPLKIFATEQFFRSRGLYYRLDYGAPLGLLATLSMWNAVWVMVLATPIRKRIGLRAERDAQWYRAAARGLLAGWKRTLVDPPKALRS